MRKGIVMEHKKGYTIVMTHNGGFHRAIKLHEAEVGMEVEFEPVSTIKFLSPLLPVPRGFLWRSGLILLILTLVYWPVSNWFGSTKAYAYVTIDLNPSLELKLNANKEVIEISPNNAEAEEILSKLSGWKKQQVSIVALKIVQLSKDKGWMNDKNQLLIGVSHLNPQAAGELASKLKQYLATQMKDLSIAAYLIPDSIQKEAGKTGDSVHQFLARQLDGNQSSSEEPLNSINFDKGEKDILQSFFEESSPGFLEDSQDYTPRKQSKEGSSLSIISCLRTSF